MVSQYFRDNALKFDSKVSRADSLKCLTSYNPILLNIKNLINECLAILEADLNLKEKFS